MKFQIKEKFFLFIVLAFWFLIIATIFHDIKLSQKYNGFVPKIFDEPYPSAVGSRGFKSGINKLWPFCCAAHQSSYAKLIPLKEALKRDMWFVLGCSILTLLWYLKERRILFSSKDDFS